PGLGTEVTFGYRQIIESGSIGPRRFGLLPRGQVQVDQGATFYVAADMCLPEIQLIYDLEQAILKIVTRPIEQPTADCVVKLLPILFTQPRVGSLLHAVMSELHCGLKRMQVLVDRARVARGLVCTIAWN